MPEQKTPPLNNHAKARQRKLTEQAAGRTGKTVTDLNHQ